MQKNERQQITWCHAQNEVSLRVLYKFLIFNSTLFICLKFVFIEMLDKHITYISVLIQDFVSGLACCVNIPHHNSLNLLSWLVVILVHTTDSIWYKVLYHHTMYVMSMYHKDYQKKMHTLTNCKLRLRPSYKYRDGTRGIDQEGFLSTLKSGAGAMFLSLLHWQKIF